MQLVIGIFLHCTYIPRPTIASFGRHDSLDVLKRLQPNPRFFHRNTGQWASYVNTYACARGLLEQGGSSTMSLVDGHDNLFVVHCDGSNMSIECIVWYHPQTSHLAYLQNVYEWCTRNSSVHVWGEFIGNEGDRSLWNQLVRGSSCE